MQPFWVSQRTEIVDHRGADARPSRRHHPVCEVQHVRLTEEAFSRRASEPAPDRSHGVCERHGREAPSDRKVRQRQVEELPPTDADRAEGDQLVRSICRLHHALQGTEDVISDARARMRQRRDVVGDPHGAV